GGSLHLPFRGAALDGLALVVELPPPGQGQRHLRVTAAKVEIERNQREPLLLDGADQAPDLAGVQEQFAGPKGIDVPIAGRVVRADVHSVDPYLAVLDPRERAGHVDAPGAHGLDLRPRENDAGLPRVE